MIQPSVETVVNAKELASKIASVDFSGSSATVLGYGNMGKHYLQALQSLGIGQIRVCSRSQEHLNPLAKLPNVTTIAGGFESLECVSTLGELAIVATPIAELIPATKHLADLGFKKILIEKPASLWSKKIIELEKYLTLKGVGAYCAYNRVTYPSLVETRFRAAEEGGITSCAYSFTEIISEDWEQHYSADELSRWGVANSLHPISMAHGLIGQPRSWGAHTSGSLPWHPSASVFVGSGLSEQDVPFSYQADWGSKGRWSVEINTAVASYRICPLEKLFRKTSSLGEWEEIPLAVFDGAAKTGVAEELASMFSQEIAQVLPVMNLKETSSITAFGEDIFGYSV